MQGGLRRCCLVQLARLLNNMTVSQWRIEPKIAGIERPSFVAFFSYGFRPFFLGAAVYAVVIMAVWLCWIATVAANGSHDWLPVAGSPYAWHAHEMVFGFAGAAVAGFLLTAVPNWTGALPLSGTPLALMFAVWFAGRLVIGLSGVLPYPLVAGVDLAFLPVLGAVAARQLFIKPALRNVVFLIILAALTLTNVTYHLAISGILAINPLIPMRHSVILVAIMIAIIGGRIIPTFTHNWLHLYRKADQLPQRVGWLDAASIISIAIFALLEVAGGPVLLLGGAALIAAVLNATRLALWRGFATLEEPIIWILHLGYAWIVVGLLLSAAAALTNFVSGAISIHAFATGAIGTMVMAVMSRASLGHTGRPLIAPRAIVAAYWLITLAALFRVLGPLLAPQYDMIILTGAALAWIAAFGLFAFVYAPILTTPRVHTKSVHS